MTLLEQVRRMLARFQSPASGCVVAVSGGADSVALLRALISLREPDDSGPIVIAHLNHCLRGAESAADESFVVDLHRQMLQSGVANLVLRRERIDIGRLSKESGDNLEAVARQARYEWFGQVAAEHGLLRVATGHTADDQAETVLHRLLRGTGLQGLRGIADRRMLMRCIYAIRPLLSTTRADVLEYLKEFGQPFREDQSNADLRFTRNRIRHELLPQLTREYNPELASLLTRLAEQANEVFAGVEEQAMSLLKEVELPPAGDMRILDRSRLAAAPRYLIREVPRLVWRYANWSCDGMRFIDWDRIAGVVMGEIPAVDLPGNIHVRARDRVVQIGC
jgi:tRNA(Ile)-lysidine synthase